MRVPQVVFEIAPGILLGPAVLGRAHPDQVIDTLSDLGLSVLIFLAGYEIDFAAVRGPTLRRAGAAWLVSLAVAVAVAFGIGGGEPYKAFVIGTALVGTSLGTVLPIPKDGGDLHALLHGGGALLMVPGFAAGRAAARRPRLPAGPARPGPARPPRPRALRREWAVSPSGPVTASGCLPAVARSWSVAVNSASQTGADRLVPPASRERALLARGVSVRAAYAGEVLAVPEYAERPRGLVALGEQARVLPRVPTKLIVVDGREALVPLTGSDEGMRTAAVLVRRSGLSDALTELFEVHWTQGTPIFATPAPRHSSTRRSRRRTAPCCNCSTPAQGRGDRPPARPEPAHVAPPYRRTHPAARCVQPLPGGHPGDAPRPAVRAGRPLRPRLSRWARCRAGTSRRR